MRPQSQVLWAAGQTLWTGTAGAVVYATPDFNGAILARLPGNQPLRVVASGTAWGATLLWNALPAWVPLASLTPRPFTRGCRGAPH